jgi:hypothetical protein
MLTKFSARNRCCSRSYFERDALGSCYSTFGSCSERVESLGLAFDSYSEPWLDVEPWLHRWHLHPPWHFCKARNISSTGRHNGKQSFVCHALAYDHGWFKDASATFRKFTGTVFPSWEKVFSSPLAAVGPRWSVYTRRSCSRWRSSLFSHFSGLNSNASLSRWFFSQRKKVRSNSARTTGVAAFASPAPILIAFVSASAHRFYCSHEMGRIVKKHFHESHWLCHQFNTCTRMRLTEY